MVIPLLVTSKKQILNSSDGAVSYQVFNALLVLRPFRLRDMGFDPSAQS